LSYCGKIAINKQLHVSTVSTLVLMCARAYVNN
jgi:hypothetical protein